MGMKSRRSRESFAIIIESPYGSGVSFTDQGDVQEDFGLRQDEATLWIVRRDGRKR